MINVFIVGSKGIPAKYGGFETFIENLTKRKISSDIKYFVSGMDDKGTFNYNGATCYSISLKKQSSFLRILNVSRALKWAEDYIKRHDDKENIIVILGCRVGLLLPKHKRALKKLGCKIICNPDGLEWKREKWNRLEKIVLRLSEKRLISNSDSVVCDSLNIQRYVLDNYKKIDQNKIHFIPYGAEIAESTCPDSKFNAFLSENKIQRNEYYLIVARFVPENNFELVIKEFIKTKSSKKLLIISNVEENSYYSHLKKTTHFNDDSRVVFAGTCYDQELLRKIRENSFAYIHGHSVGGTNPSLLEALASTRINILFDVCYNKEVGGDECLYFFREENNLCNLIESVEKDPNKFISRLRPQSRINEFYSWDKIVHQYEDLFLNFKDI